MRGQGAAAMNEIAIKSVELLLLFTKYELTKQWQAEEKVHNERVRQMREDEAQLTEERLRAIKQLSIEEARSKK